MAQTENTGTVFMPGEIGSIPPVPGAYGLLIRLENGFSGRVGAMGKVILSPGHYLYLGSALGPGGIRSRVARHCRVNKKRHWHIDYLTAAGHVERIICVAGGSECGLVAEALLFPGVSAPVAGFGSSDCDICESHMLSLPAGVLGSILMVASGEAR